MLSQKHIQYCLTVTDLSATTEHIGNTAHITQKARGIQSIRFRQIFIRPSHSVVFSLRGEGGGGGEEKGWRIRMDEGPEEFFLFHPDFYSLKQFFLMFYLRDCNIACFRIDLWLLKPVYSNKICFERRNSIIFQLFDIHN